MPDTILWRRLRARMRRIMWPVRVGTFIASVTLAALVTACQNQANSPREVLRTYLRQTLVFPSCCRQRFRASMYFSGLDTGKVKMN